MHIDYFNTLPQGIFRAEKGMYDFNRLLAADSTPVAQGHVLYALEYAYKNGPWDLPEGYRKYNGFLRYSQGDELNGMNISFQGYSSKWAATDEVPLSAIEQGTIGRFGYVDPTDGGKTDRNTVSLRWWRNDALTSKRVTLYAVHEHLNLYSNFSYYLPEADGGYKNGATVGDQIEQVDRRDYYGFRGSYSRLSSLFGFDSENTVGLHIRYDDIPQVALYHTSQRARLETIVNDSVNETRYSLYAKNDTRWTQWLRTIAGVRTDIFDFSVGANIPANSGTVVKGVVEPKLSMIFGPWSKTEYYLNMGQGIHSNDARGVLTKVDPSNGQAATPATPVVRSRGMDLGLRTAIIPKVQMALSLWALNLDSELVFSGDGGTTEASYPSRRLGFEFSTYYRPLPWLIADLDVADTRARYKDNPAGRYIPNAVEGVISGGVSVNHATGVFGGLRVRYIGPRP